MTQKSISDKTKFKPLRDIVIEPTERINCLRLAHELAYALFALLDEQAKAQLSNIEFNLTKHISFAQTSEKQPFVLSKENIMLAKSSETASVAHDLALDLAENSSTKLTIDQYKDLLTYYLLRNLYNCKINLSRIETSDLIIETDIRDCFYLADKIKTLPHGDKRILDIGTGSGVPGLILAIIMPEFQYTLLDTVQKKLAFLDIVIKQLNLKNCELVWSRVENFAHTKARHSFDFVLSRAVSSLATLLEYSLPLTKIGAYCLCLKTSLETKTDAHKLLSLLGAEQGATFVYKEASNGREHLILEFKQVAKISVDFPRQLNLPRKESLDIM